MITTEIDGILHVFGESLRNRKTGPLYTTTHLNASAHPIQSRRESLDSKTSCKGCKLSDGRGCYVNPMMLSSIWKAAQKEKRLTLQEFTDAASALAKRLDAVRFGNFGNPTTLPTEILFQIQKAVSVSLGYCADWQGKDVQTILMASTSSTEETLLALEEGYSCYQISKNSKEDKFSYNRLGIKAVVCPYQQSASYVSCRSCGLCDPRKKKIDVVLIEPHGSQKNKVFAV